MRVTTFGVAAHGANPDRGVNAIGKMARVIQAINESPVPHIELPRVGEVRGTYNVGVIEGGQMFFIVPDRCSIWVDRRTVPGETQDEALQRLRAAVASVDPAAEVVVERQDWSWDRIRARGIGSCSIDPDSPIVRAIADATETVTGHPAQYYVQSAWCETDFLVNDLHIPTVNFGPGKMELAHTSDEHIEIDSLLQGVEILALALTMVGR
jgi:acetylornithine deacetylase/succinyl-diaminopimelate desuccinylase-like protein